MEKQKITNPFYNSIMRDGIQIATERPLKRGQKITNPYYEQIQKAGGVTMHTHPGRPSADKASAPTKTKSIRLPPAIWKRAEAEAKAEGLSLHAALRQAVLIWLKS